MSPWRAVTLGELVEEAGGSIRTGPFGSQLHASEYVSDRFGIPVVMPRDMTGGRILDTGIKRVDQSTAERLGAHRCVEGDLLLARRGDVGRLAFVDADHTGCLCGTGSIRIHAPNHHVVDRSFLRYLMQAPATTDWLSRQAVGATMPNLNEAIVGAMPVSLPPSLIQRRIAQVLLAFDELIEINERRIDRLKAFMRSYVRHKVDDPARLAHGSARDGTVGPEELPAGWRWCTLGDVARLNYGKSLPKARRRPGDVAVVSSAGVIDAHDTAFSDGPGLVIGRKGNVGATWWIDEAFYPIDTTFFVESDLPLGFLYWALQGVPFINSHAAVPGLSRDQALAVEIVLPPSNLVAEIASVHREVFRAIAAYRKVVGVVRRNRGLLLPRLVTGQLDISDIDLGILTPVESE